MFPSLSTARSVEFQVSFSGDSPGEQCSAYKPGEDTSYDAWHERAEREGFFKEEKIKERLYSMI